MLQMRRGTGDDDAGQGSGGAASGAPLSEPKAAGALSDPEAAPGGALARLKSSRKLQLRVAFGVYVVLVLTVMLAIGANVTIALGLVFAPFLVYYLFRFMYVRTLKPFTIDVPDGKDRPTGWTRRDVVATVVFWTVIVGAFVPAAISDMVVSDEPVSVMVFAYNLLGSLAILICALVVVDGADMCFNLATKGKNPKTWFSLGVRAQRTKVGVAALLYIIVTSVALAQSYDAPVAIEKDVFLDDFPSCLDGYKMVLVSDVHSGPLVGRAENTRLVAQINALGGDTVVFVGDFADGTPEDVGGAVEPFAGVVAPDGSYFVTGNHEYIHGGAGDIWETYWRSIGVEVLNSTRTTLPLNTSLCGTDQFYLAGVQDFADGDPDLEAALAGRDPSIATTVLLAHQPAQSEDAAKLGVKLQLSGHVHSGQIYPLHGLTYLVQPHFSGLEAEDDDMLVYTSQGAFGWGPRTRFGSRNNIDVLTLYSADAGENDLSLHYSIIWAWMSFPFIIIPIVVGVWYNVANGGCGGCGARCCARTLPSKESESSY